MKKYYYTPQTNSQILLVERQSHDIVQRKIIQSHANFQLSHAYFPHQLSTFEVSLAFACLSSKELDACYSSIINIQIQRFKLSVPLKKILFYNNETDSACCVVGHQDISTSDVQLRLHPQWISILQGWEFLMSHIIWCWCLFLLQQTTDHDEYNLSRDEGNMRSQDQH